MMTVRDRYILLAAYGALFCGVMCAVELPEFWDEDTLNAFLISIPCLTLLAFFVEDAITAAKDAERQKECIHFLEMVLNG
jgi:hypothetical protein